MMSKIPCLIIDDEPFALDLLERYIDRTPFLELKRRCCNIGEAIEELGKTKIELLFLDIQMPELSGIEFSRIYGRDKKVVFTTAFSKYAIDGFKVDALDYLLKPIGYEDFLKASKKAKEWFDLKEARQNSINNHIDDNIIFVRSGYKQIKINLDDIYCIEGLKDYVKIWIEGRSKPIITLLSLKSLDEVLPSSKFMRIHRSFVISLDKIQQVERNRVILTNEVSICLSDPYKIKFRNFLSGRSIT